MSVIRSNTGDVLGSEGETTLSFLTITFKPLLRKKHKNYICSRNNLNSLTHYDYSFCMLKIRSMVTTALKVRVHLTNKAMAGVNGTVPSSSQMPSSSISCVAPSGSAATVLVTGPFFDRSVILVTTFVIVPHRFRLNLAEEALLSGKLNVY
jgi:hypothetical protein